MIDRLVWERDGADWPNRTASRFVAASGIDWHVQEIGPAVPASSRLTAVLVHGTGASTHSWADVLPRLAGDCRVLAFDLPGHAFTSMPPRERMTLPGMAQSVRDLLAAVGVVPDLVVGHSAGAAILARMCLDRMIAPREVISLNGALLPFRGVGRLLFQPLARLLARSSLVPDLFARRADDPATVDRLLRGTGSLVPPRQAALYGRLMSCRAHDAAALAMMAGWDLDPLARELPRLAPSLVLVVGGNDTTIPPEQAFKVRDLAPAARVVYLRGLGHLMHEEQPERIANVILQDRSGGP